MLRKWVTNEMVTELIERINTTYNELRKLVQSYIDLIKLRGKEIICVCMLWKYATQ